MYELRSEFNRNSSGLVPLGQDPSPEPLPGSKRRNEGKPASQWHEGRILVVESLCPADNCLR